MIKYGTQYSKHGHTIDLHNNIMMLVLLFSILFLMVPSMEFAFFTVSAHWADIFTEISTLPPTASFQVGQHHSERICEILKIFCPSVRHFLLAYTVLRLPFYCPLIQFGDILSELFTIPFCLTHPEQFDISTLGNLLQPCWHTTFH